MLHDQRKNQKRRRTQKTWTPCRNLLNMIYIFVTIFLLLAAFICDLAKDIQLLKKNIAVLHTNLLHVKSETRSMGESGLMIAADLDQLRSSYKSTRLAAQKFDDKRFEFDSNSGICGEIK